MAKASERIPIGTVYPVWTGIAKSLNHIAVLRLDIEHITGKESIELVRMRKAVQS